MTNCERLIKAHTESATLTTISVATERVAEEMAGEMLKDPVFRDELRALARDAFGHTMRELAKNGHGQSKRTRARKK